MLYLRNYIGDNRVEEKALLRNVIGTYLRRGTTFRKTQNVTSLSSIALRRSLWISKMNLLSMLDKWWRNVKMSLLGVIGSEKITPQDGIHQIPLNCIFFYEWADEKGGELCLRVCFKLKMKLHREAEWEKELLAVIYYPNLQDTGRDTKMGESMCFLSIVFFD